MHKILVIDNDKNTTETISGAITSVKDYAVDVAYSGQEGLEKMKANPSYDLIVLDLMMPGMSGIDVCKTMAKDRNLKKIPVLIVSALPVYSKAFQKSQLKFKELGVVKDVLEKPFEIDALLEKISNILQ